jgi:hypothetical protein
MSFNGSGTFVINTAGQPVVSGTVISSTAFNALTADLATGLSTCITKDGQTTPTANIPMGNNKITNLAVGTAATDAANLSQVQSTTAKLVNSISGADTITGTMSPNLAAYATGQMFYFIAAGDNTGAVTLNIDSLGAKAVTRDGSVALAAGDIKSGEVVVVVYDGTRFQVVSQINSSGNATFANVSITSALNVGGVATFSAGTAAAPSITTSGDTNNGIFFPATDVTAITTAGSERLRVDASGNMGLGVTPSAWNSGVKAFQLGSGGRTALYQDTANNLVLSYNNVQGASSNTYLATGANASLYAMLSSGQHAWYTSPSGTAGGTISFTQAMTLTAGGFLGLGTASPASAGGVAFVVYDSSTPRIRLTNSTTGEASTDGAEFNLSGSDLIIENRENAPTRFFNNGSERARITSGGIFLVGKTTDGVDTNGVELNGGGVVGVSRQADIPMYVNRNGDDGILVSLRQGGVNEGSISVSGTTVSYNAFAGSHWSQLQNGSKPDILRGTVMESINELCVWPDENNERLPKSKVSDTAGSKKVYGVFMAWDNDWTTTNDMYVTAVGAFICRVNGSVTVQEGDLLESNGDGTARVQADDIIRSSTIGKVTSTVKTHEYDDGSYCVPTVLYCG